MNNTTFDPEVVVGGVTLFKGQFTDIDLFQPPALPHNANNRVIDPAQPFAIRIRWEVTGPEVPLRMNAVGNWQIYVYAESMGGGPERSLGNAEFEQKGTILANQMSWEHTINVSGGLLEEHDDSNVPGAASGVYKLVVVVFANSNLPGPGSDVVGFAEIPMILAERPQ